MRFILLAVACLFASVASADTVVVRGRATVVQTAQDAAVVIARRGALVHSGCSQTEGIGFSTESPDAAIRRCCFWGKRQPVDIGVAWSPLRRGWFAVVRYR